MLRPSLPRLAAARVTSNIRSRVGHDVWGEVHITGLTEPSLATAKASRPSLLRHEPSDYIDLLGGFAAVSTRSGADWPRLLKGNHHTCSTNTGH